MIRRIRFRTSTLLWLMVVVTAFYLGQRSDEIARRISQLLNRGPTNAATAIRRTKVNGSIVLTWKDAVSKIHNGNPSVANVGAVDSNQIRFTPMLDGVAELVVCHADGQMTQVEITVADGDIVSLSESQSPQL